MSPRSREQQDDYNKRRRQENAAKLANGAVASGDKKVAKSTPKPTDRPKGKAVKPTRDPAHTPKARAVPRKGQPAGAGHPGDTPKVKVDWPALRPTHTFNKPVTLAKDAPTIQAGVPKTHTMARSYVRTSGAGQGKLRAGTYQATVSFTREQRDRLVAAAEFRCVSLAEMIRSCVVEHLTKKLS